MTKTHASFKDLSYLNRDLSKTILLDTNAEHATLQPENSIIIKPWEGKLGDKGLIDMIPFLECKYRLSDPYRAVLTDFDSYWHL